MKTKLMSPVSMHKFFEFGNADREERKTRVEQIAYEYLCKMKGYQQHERKHDMADAMCYVIKFLHDEKLKESMKLENNPFKVFAYDGI